MDVPVQFSDVVDVPASWMFQHNRLHVRCVDFTTVEKSPYWALDVTSCVDCELFQVSK